MSTQIVGIALRLRVALRMPLTISSDDRSLEWDFCLIFAPLRATMIQKSSLPQAAKSVSRVLMSDSLRGGRCNRHSPSRCTNTAAHVAASGE